MKILYVYAHPEPRSFNGALKDAAMVTLAVKGHDVKVSNLYAVRFKAILDAQDFRIRGRHDIFNPAAEQIHGIRTGSLAPDIQEEIERVSWADLIIFQFPLWWSSMPAILKGWFDRVFAQGFVVDIEAGKVYGQGLLKGKRGMLVVTCGSSEEMYSPSGVHGDIRRHLSVIEHNILEFTGIEVLPPFLVFEVPSISADRAGQVLKEYESRLAALPL
ncbi:MAG TPA: NAD(P)H-dependent oxidoreductase [Methanolinea sp.]|jgi:NAD(P)H dehydrogenase (quinone)|nr:MAG: hypothetical protein A4E36_00600 [Methanoregulaceae archaeon PtaB.Bin009]OPY38818.1 MAG: hypothetical protein A4E41_01832 [Methanoregulaceae archaeon PtaU1.Bin066]HII75953.1 NAD(P)H-dependent oxidoreductase [Methanolinea sp.]HNQ28772.1 NAD(P)H-dependent oxidoreductase [Methanolinea sp.]